MLASGSCHTPWLPSLDMETRRVSAVALAALELLPAEPSDLAGVLADQAQRDALLSLTARADSSPLTAYLCTELDHGRVELWEKRLSSYAAEVGLASPV